MKYSTETKEKENKYKKTHRSCYLKRIAAPKQVNRNVIGFYYNIRTWERASDGEIEREICVCVCIRIVWETIIRICERRKKRLRICVMLKNGFIWTWHLLLFPWSKHCNQIKAKWKTNNPAALVVFKSQERERETHTYSAMCDISNTERNENANETTKPAHWNHLQQSFRYILFDVVLFFSLNARFSLSFGACERASERLTFRKLIPL